MQDRKYDLVLARSTPPSDALSTEDLNREILFYDPMVIAAGPHTHWARRRHIDIAELADQPWIMPPPGTWLFAHLAEAFQERGLDVPKASLVTMAWPLVAGLLAGGHFITVRARTLVHHYSLKELPVNLPRRPWPVQAITLKHRTLSPVVERFIDAAREVTKSLGGPLRASER